MKEKEEEEKVEKEGGGYVEGGMEGGSWTSYYTSNKLVLSLSRALRDDLLSSSENLKIKGIRSALAILKIKMDPARKESNYRQKVFFARSSWTRSLKGK